MSNPQAFRVTITREIDIEVTVMLGRSDDGENDVWIEDVPTVPVEVLDDFRVFKLDDKLVEVNLTEAEVQEAKRLAWALAEDE